MKLELNVEQLNEDVTESFGLLFDLFEIENLNRVALEQKNNGRFFEYRVFTNLNAFCAPEASISDAIEAVKLKIEKLQN